VEIGFILLVSLFSPFLFVFLLFLSLHLSSFWFCFDKGKKKKERKKRRERKGDSIGRQGKSRGRDIERATSS